MVLINWVKVIIMRVERICPNEAEALYDCMKQIDQEAQYMLYLPEERTFNKDKLVEHLRYQFYIGVKTEDNKIMGYLSVHMSTLYKLKHIGYISIGLVEELQQQGLATKMFEETIKWAKRKGLRRLELTVITYNTPAIKFYEKLGFKIEGIKRESIYMNEHFYDELYMAMMLNEMNITKSDNLW